MDAPHTHIQPVKTRDVEMAFDETGAPAEHSQRTSRNNPRREYRNINVVTDLPHYRLPAAGWVSILHRISGVILVLSLPALIWLLEGVLMDPATPPKESTVPPLLTNVGLGVLIWATAHHLFAGLRHLWMDFSHRAVEKDTGGQSAVLTLVFGALFAAAACAMLL